jgi:hypothetical protein
MSEMPAHEVGVLLLSSSFAVALIAAGIVGKIGGFQLGAAAGLASVGVMSLVAAALTWHAGPQPERGMIRVEGVVSEPARPKDAPAQRDWNEPSSNDAVVRFTDASGRAHEIPGYELPQPVRIGERVMVDYPTDGPGSARVVDPNFHRTMLMVFALFGVVPTLMGLTVFVSVREDRARRDRAVSPRPAALVAACRYARIAANLALLYGFYVTFSRDGLESIARGFPIIGAAAGAHGVIGALAGIRLSAVLIYLVVAAGFVGFGMFAGSAG